MLISAESEFELKGLKLWVNVTPTLPSSVNTWFLLVDAEAPFALMTPSVKHDIADAMMAIFLIISIL
jgi:hypothetical protein